MASSSRMSALTTASLSISSVKSIFIAEILPSQNLLKHAPCALEPLPDRRLGNTKHPRYFRVRKFLDVFQLQRILIYCRQLQHGLCEAIQIIGSFQFFSGGAERGLFNRNGGMPFTAVIHIDGGVPNNNNNVAPCFVTGNFAHLIEILKYF